MAVARAFPGLFKARSSQASIKGQMTRCVSCPCSSAWLLVGWCEIREDFRTFRTDRVIEADFLDDRYPAPPAVLRTRWFAMMEAQKAECEAAQNAAVARA